jgi:hypothetical protein
MQQHRVYKSCVFLEYGCEREENVKAIPTMSLPNSVTCLLDSAEQLALASVLGPHPMAPRGHCETSDRSPHRPVARDTPESL